MGLGLDKLNESETNVSKEAKALMEKREVLRKEGKFKEADEIRKRIKKEFDLKLEDTKA